MINKVRDYYKNELEDRKGEILSIDELPVDLIFMTMPANVQKTVVIPYLVNENKLKMYFGIQANANILPVIAEKIGEVKLFNDIVKQKGPFVDTRTITIEVSEMLKDIKGQEEYNEKFKEEFDKIFNKKVEEAKELHRKEIAATTTTATIKIHDDYMLVPTDIDLKDYEKIRRTVEEEGYSVYNEEVFVEIL